MMVESDILISTIETNFSHNLGTLANMVGEISRRLMGRVSILSTKLTVESLIYNALGQEVLKTKQKNIDVSRLSTGNYLIIVKDINTNNFNSFHIVKL